MDQASSSPSQLTGDKVSPDTANTLLNWDYAKTKLTALKAAWETGEAMQTQIRRDLRSIRVDVEDMRSKGEMDADETFVPIRIIDSNITKEAAPFIEYLSQPDRLVVMKSREGIPESDLRFRESEFTRVMRYEGWILPFIKVQDGAATHGWDSVEVIYDETKPGHVAIDHVRHDELWIPQDTRNIQDCEYVVRKYMVSIYALRKLIKSGGFIEERVQKIMDAVKTSSGSTSSVSLTLFPLHKVMFKVDGVVYVGWWSPEVSEGWLDGDAKKLYLGRRQGVAKDPGLDAFGNPLPPTGELDYSTEESMLPETEYPYYLLYYRETEMPDIFQHVGRVYLDEPKQDAASTLMTAFVNGTTRSTNFFASPKENSNGATTLEVLSGVQLQNNCVYNMPLNFSNLPAPDPGILRGIQQIQSLNADESQTVAFAVNNRKDSRKSATEINAAQEQQQTLSGVSLVMQSTFLVAVFTRCEEIINARALAGLLPDYCLVDGKLDRELLQIQVQLRPAGDVDVVERKERLQAMVAGFPLIQNTPIAGVFLADLLRLALPGTGEKYAKMLEQGNPKDQFIQNMMQTVEKLVTDPKTGQLWPMLKPAEPILIQLAQQANAVLQS